MIYTILEAKNPQVIKTLLAIDDMYDVLAYDGSPPLSEYTPEGIWFILLRNGYTAGFITLDPLNNVTWVAHVAILEKYRGKESEEWGKLVAQRMTQKYGAKKFLAITPYDAAKRYAERVGFKQIAVLNNSIRKNGVLLHQYLLELGEQK